MKEALSGLAGNNLFEHIVTAICLILLIIVLSGKKKKQ